MAESGPGKVHLFDDFCGPEIPLAIAVANTAAAGYYIGPWAIKGDTDTNDAGVVALAVPGGAVRLTTTNEDTLGCALTTDLILSPSLMGPIVVEARVQNRALSAQELFIGICGTIADDVRSPLTYVGATTATLTASDFCGFFMSEELTATANWHAVYNGGSATGPTTIPDTGITAVVSEWDVLRLVIDTNGTARWWINGNLEQTVVGAVSTTVAQGVICGAFADDATVADMDVDYLLLDANRDWTR